MLWLKKGFGAVFLFDLMSSKFIFLFFSSWWELARTSVPTEASLGRTMVVGVVVSAVEKDLRGKVKMGVVLGVEVVAVVYVFEGV